jgi:hypothetical protein
MITGISEASQDAGRHPGWPNEKVAAAVIEKVASEWTGPERLPEGHVLTKQAALEIEARLVKAANHIIKAEGLQPAARTKTASQDDLTERANSAALFWMQKAADEAGGSLTTHGPNTLGDAARTDQLAALEQRQRPEGYALQQPGGATTLPEAKVTGPRETAPPTTPSVSPAISNSLTEHSQKAAALRDPTAIAARALAKSAAEEDEGNGPPSSPPSDAPDPAGPPGGAAPPESAEHEQSEMDLLQKIWGVLQQLAPQSDDAAAATAGLAAHPDGMQVLAHVVNTAKTAAQADEMLSKVLADNPTLRKIASVEAFLDVKQAYKQAGAGSLTTHGPNSVADAAKTDQLSALENKQRPAGYANNSEPGKTDLPAPAPTGRIMPAPRDGVPPVTASNVVTREDKKASDEEFMAQLAKVAQEYGPMIPTTVPEGEKVAALCALIGTPPSRREAELAKRFPPAR